jgi:hypothetical protein
MSQLRDGSRGRLSSHDGGIPVYSRAVRKPDLLRGGEASAFMPNHGTSQVRTGFFLGSPGPTHRSGSEVVAKCGRFLCFHCIVLLQDIILNVSVRMGRPLV